MDLVVNYVSVNVMKRFLPILFLLVYTLSVVGSTIERTQALAAERTQDSKRGGRPPARINEWHRRAAHQLWQTKFFEDGSFLVSPFVRTNPPHFETALQHFSVGFDLGQNVQVFQSRAPPAAAV
jgi:hypothetical protein